MMLLIVQSTIFLQVVLVIFHCISPATGLTGVDLSTRVALEDWDILEASLGDIISFASVHTLFYNKTLNPNAVTTLVSAWQKGIRDLSIYAYPCITGSEYSRKQKVICATAELQVEQVVKYMSDNGIEFVEKASPDGLPPSNYAKKTFGGTNYNNVTLSKLFLNIEDSLPNYFFNLEHSKNIEFLADYINAAASYGIAVGIYTTTSDWMNIMPELYAGQNVYKINGLLQTNNPFKNIPIWLPRYDGLSDVDFFSPFAGWNRVAMKQLSGGSTEARRIGSGRICVDFKPVNSSIGDLEYLVL
jgi:hypothetical protein